MKSRCFGRPLLTHIAAAAAAAAHLRRKFVSGQFDKENPFVLISSVLLVQADEGVSFLVVDRIGDIYHNLPRRADVIVTTVGARHKCQQEDIERYLESKGLNEASTSTSSSSVGGVGASRVADVRAFGARGVAGMRTNSPTIQQFVGANMWLTGARLGSYRHELSHDSRVKEGNVGVYPRPRSWADSWRTCMLPRVGT
ncbi:hypothetical protein F511_28853 [Dorcoceras hygrometricum]|uniref:Uncharacterized protein n=1 Tax=Dorcoceras hygrometricum TaxID=472368 RepID=A0A2Z7BHG5_9LAMI|nr:hypothetical protein F511_28853 [Dorcoceras hygrometricum]